MSDPPTSQYIYNGPPGYIHMVDAGLKTLT